MKQREIRIPFKGILGVQFAIVTIVVIEIFGAGWLVPPVLKFAIGSIYLTLVPGFLILKALRIETSLTKTVLYSVGLSISFLMLIGLLLNAISVEMGYLSPISYTPLVTTITVTTFILYACSLKTEKSHPKTECIKSRVISSPSFLLPFILPILSILGTFMVNADGNNVFLLFLIIAIACMVILVAKGYVPKRLYPLFVFLIAISLLYHRSLITNYLVGWDVQAEYREFNLVVNHFWDSARANPYDSALSISILPAALSIFLGVDGIWIFKLVFPLIYALVPVGLFEVYRKQIDDYAAFLSSFLFMSFFTFFQEMLQLGRQQIAETFLVLCILLLLETGIEKPKKALLLMVFSASIVLSHYVIAIAFMGFLVLTLVLFSVRNLLSRKSIDRGLSKEIRGLYVILFIVFFLSWYVFTSNAVIINRLVGSFSNVIDSLRNFFFIEARDRFVQQTLITTTMKSWGREIARLIFYVVNLLILLGVLKILIRPKKTKFDRTFLAMALISLGLLSVSLLLPYFTQIINATRVYHLTIIFLAPFCVVGFLYVFDVLERISRVRFLKLVCPVFILVLLLSNFFFNTGFVFETTGDIPSSISLSKYRMDGPYYGDAEVLGAKWLIDSREANQSSIYGDEYGWLIFLGYLPVDELGYFTLGNETVPENKYVFLRYLNVEKGTMLVRTTIEQDEWQYVNMSDILGSPEKVEYGSKIYDNDYCSVLFGD